MKKTLLFTLFLAMNSLAFGQVPTDGPLKIVSPNSNGYTQVGPLNPYFSHFITDRPLHYFDKTITVNGAIGSYSDNLKLQAARSTKMTITTGGKVGIGTSSPSEKLHISNGNLRLSNSTGGIIITPHATLDYSANIISGPVIGAERNSIIHFWTKNPATDAESTWHWNLLRCGGTQIIDENNYGRASYTTVIRLSDIHHKLNVYINDDGTAKFSGKVTAKEIEVKPDVWSDFVFKKDYNLLSLHEVSQYIADHGHLPDVPSEKDVLEEGINLGEMNALLLQKIEELTLYTIEQQKLIEKQSEKIRHLEKIVLSK
jgi:hypothetical protein